MSENTITQIRTQGQKLLSALERNFYLNYSGLSKKSRIEEIFKSHREFGDQELFYSISEKAQESEHADKGLNLLKSFLANMFIQSRCGGTADKILTLESSLRLKIGNKKTPFRSTHVKSLKTNKKRKRDEIELYRTKALEELIPGYMEMRYQTDGAAEELGFSNYAQIEEYPGKSVSEQAKLFLKDTEYVSTEMLKWYFPKYLDIELKDASVSDLHFLLNSFELKGGFPDKEYVVPAARVLDDSGLVNRSDVQANSEKRKGKAPYSMLFLTLPPREMKVSIYPSGGPEDYEAYLSALGSALSFAFTDNDEDFEYRYLRDPVQTGIFSELFKNLIYESTWLERYIEEERNKDFYKLLYLRRLMNVRFNAGAAVYEAILYSGEDTENLKAAYKETMEGAVNVSVSDADFLSPKDIRKPLQSAASFKSSLIEPSLSGYLKERHDEEWWRVRNAGSELRGIWAPGGRVSSEDISELTNFNDSSEKLLSIFERELG